MNVLVAIANGSEEMEAVIIIDTLRRAQWNVVVAGLSEGPITASRGVQLIPDTTWDQIKPSHFDLLILPGGMGGTEAFMGHSGIQQTLRDFSEKRKWIGAICAAPMALDQAGILTDRQYTCYPGCEKKMQNQTRSDETVVIDGHIITSQGPGTAFEFALKLIAECDSPNQSAHVRAGLLL